MHRVAPHVRVVVVVRSDVVSVMWCVVWYMLAAGRRRGSAAQSGVFGSSDGPLGVPVAGGQRVLDTLLQLIGKCVDRAGGSGGSLLGSSGRALRDPCSCCRL
jgi:hypothetical protein